MHAHDFAFLSHHPNQRHQTRGALQFLKTSRVSPWDSSEEVFLPDPHKLVKKAPLGFSMGLEGYLSYVFLHQYRNMVEHSLYTHIEELQLHTNLCSFHGFSSVASLVSCRPLNHISSQ